MATVRSLLRLICILAVAASICIAEEIKIATMTPLAWQPGKRNVVTVQGKGLVDAKSLWTTFTQTSTILTQSDSECVFEVDIPDSTPSQYFAMRVVTTKGLSNARFGVIDRIVTSAGPISIAKQKPTKLKLPSAINATAIATQTHYFEVEISQTTNLLVDLVAARINSPFDALVRISDSNGKLIKGVDDTIGLAGDCQFAVSLSPGVYTLSVRDIQYRGGEEYRYRLRICEQKPSMSTFPLAVSALHNAVLQDLAVPFSDRKWANINTNAVIDSILASSWQEHVESEPNDQISTAEKVKLPVAVNGRFEAKHDEDWFSFSMKKGESLRAIPRHGTLASSARCYLRAFNPKGEQIAFAAESNRKSSALEVTAETTGNYSICVEDLHRKYGNDRRYRVELEKCSGGFWLTLGQSEFTVPEGGVFVAKVTVDRKSYPGPIELSIESLKGAKILQGGKLENEKLESEVHVQVPANLTHGKTTSFQIVGTSTESVKGETVPFKTAADSMPSFRKRFGPAEFPPRSWIVNQQLFVGPAFPSFVNLAEVPKRLWLPSRFKNFSFETKIERTAGFVGNVELSIEGLPKEVEVQTKPITKGTTVGRLTVTGSERLKAGKYELRVAANAKYKNQPATAKSKPVQLFVGDPFLLDVQFRNGPNGYAEALEITVERFAPSAFDIELQLADAPKDLFRDPLPVISKDETTVTLPIHKNWKDKPIAPFAVIASANVSSPSSSSDPVSLASRFMQDTLKKLGAIQFEAEDFARGNVIVDKTQYGKGIGIISDPGAQKNFAEYDVQVPAAGNYQIELRYAASSARPGRILVNGKVVNSNAISKTTGGWNPEFQQWSYEGTAAFSKGNNVLRIESEPMMSHIDRVMIVPATELITLEAEFDSWIIAGTSQTAESLDGNLISVFATDGFTGQQRIGLVDFDAASLAGKELVAAQLQLAVDGRDSKLAKGRVHSFARLLPGGVNVRTLSGQAYAPKQARTCESFAAFDIETGASLPAGSYETSDLASESDLLCLEKRIQKSGRISLALEAHEDGTKTSRDWGANDTGPQGTHGGPLPAKMVVLVKEPTDAKTQIKYVVKSKPIRFDVPQTQKSK